VKATMKWRGQGSNLHWGAEPIKLSLSFNLHSAATISPRRPPRKRRRGRGAGARQAPKMNPRTAAPTFCSSAAWLFASSRANLTAFCSFSTRSSSSLMRRAGSAPENFTVFQ
jgi:hypothetical protein